MALELLMGQEGVMRGPQAAGRANLTWVRGMALTMNDVSLNPTPRTQISLQRAGGLTSVPAELRACARA